MCGGQAIDLGSVGLALSLRELENMHRLKTGALLRASVLLGALAGKRLTPDETESLDAYSAAIGLAFQVVDDVLDATADSATLGKTAGKDAADNKPTYVAWMWELTMVRSEAEIAWCERTAKRIEAGEPYSPGGAAWPSSEPSNQV